jgi:AI-2 transport protein TqsA
MAKPIITLNGLKIVIMLGMLVIILTGVRFAADIIVPFILALFIAVILNPLVQRMTRLRIPRAGDYAADQHHYCGHGVAGGVSGHLAE